MSVQSTWYMKGYYRVKKSLVSYMKWDLSQWTRYVFVEMGLRSWSSLTSDAAHSNQPLQTKEIYLQFNKHIHVNIQYYEAWQICLLAFSQTTFKIFYWTRICLYLSKLLTEGFSKGLNWSFSWHYIDEKPWFEPNRSWRHIVSAGHSYLTHKCPQKSLNQPNVLSKLRSVTYDAVSKVPIIIWPW